MHPEKCFVRPENPTQIRLGGLTPYLRGDWQLAKRIWRRTAFEPNVPFVPPDLAAAR